MTLSNKSSSTTQTSWIDSATHQDSDFPLANLPYCAFQSSEGETHLGVGIGNLVFDLHSASSSPLFENLPANIRKACTEPYLNGLMLCGRDTHSTFRDSLLTLFAEDAPQDQISIAKQYLHPMEALPFRLPVSIGNYTDFYASIHHATNVGRLFRPGQPLLPNYKYVPIGYHGRVSSIQISGSPVTRPRGQIKPAESLAPAFSPSEQLDFELELGAYIGTGNALGQPIEISQADNYLFGVSLLNDWSARDIQSWEYQPLGPFLSKSFLTSVSPWVVTIDALTPFRRPLAERPAGDPAPLPYLSSSSTYPAAFDIQVEAFLTTQRMRDTNDAARKLTSSNAKDLYWSFAQLITHHASNGCNLLPGDLIGSGTISGPEAGACGSMLELTQRGSKPMSLANGELRGFLEDGDEVVFRAFCQREGFARIGFGECRGIVAPAHREGRTGH